jgi:hypothetical protein
MTAESENQMKSRMTESDAILRAREDDSLGFEYLYNSHRQARVQRLLAHSQKLRRR